jgi:hypothetical protein
MPKQSSRRSLRLLQRSSKIHENIETGLCGIAAEPTLLVAASQTNTSAEQMSISSTLTFHRPISGASARYNDCGVLPSE